MIRLEGVCRRFVVGEQIVDALKGVTLEVERGEYVSIMGPSGSGKSTLLNIIGLLDRPSEGQYQLDGAEVTSLPDGQMAWMRQTKIGFVFQFFHLIPRLTAAENVELPLTLAGIASEERRTRVQTILGDYGIAARALHRPDQLSGGQRQRVAIARATITEPEIVLADEPTGNLDRASGREVVDLLETLNRQGKTLLLVTHDPELGMRARRRVKMEDGRVVSDLQGSDGR